VEKRTQRALLTQTFEKIGYKMPYNRDPIKLDREPIASVESVSYLDADGVRQTLDSADWEYSVPRRAVFPAVGLAWPASIEHHDSVIVTFTAGYGATGDFVPADLQDAMLLLISKTFYGVFDVEQFEYLIAKYVVLEYP
jgi:uncharacterized phiE125 gp8 family phage protein